MLLVDAFQGIQAQTVANAYASLEHDLAIIPVINKIDAVHAQPDAVSQEMEQSLGFESTEILRVSAKTGVGIEALLEAAIDTVPPPEGDPEALSKRWSLILTTTNSAERLRMCES